MKNEKDVKGPNSPMPEPKGPAEKMPEFSPRPAKREDEFVSRSLFSRDSELR